MPLTTRELQINTDFANVTNNVNNPQRTEKNHKYNQRMSTEHSQHSLMPFRAPVTTLVIKKAYSYTVCAVDIGSSSLDRFVFIVG
jgi:hypothetical protein